MAFSLWKKRSEPVEIDLILDQIPQLVCPKPAIAADNKDDADDAHALRCRVTLRNAGQLRGKTVTATLVGERTAPLADSSILGSSTPKPSVGRFLSEEQHFVIPPSATSTWEHAVEFRLHPDLPGSLAPLDSASTAVRYRVSATVPTGAFKTATVSREVRIYRACRTDLAAIDSFASSQGHVPSLAAYTVWSPKGVVCGGRARFEIYLRKLDPSATFQRATVALTEHQSARVPVPAFHQSVPGETVASEHDFEICAKTVVFPQRQSTCQSTIEGQESGRNTGEGEFEQPATAVFDLPLPRDPKFYRRSTTRKVGVAFRHVFVVTLVVRDAGGQEHTHTFEADTVLALPPDAGSEVADENGEEQGRQPKKGADGILPPPYDDHTLPGYEVHRLDPLFGEGAALGEMRRDVVFLEENQSLPWCPSVISRAGASAEIGLGKR